MLHGIETIYLKLTSVALDICRPANVPSNFTVNSMGDVSFKLADLFSMLDKRRRTAQVDKHFNEHTFFKLRIMDENPKKKFGWSLLKFDRVN